MGQGGSVPRGGALVRRCAYQYAGGGVDALHGRLMPRMGHTGWQVFSLGILARLPAPQPYQHVKARCSHLRCKRLLSVPLTPCSVSDVRQLCGSVIHQVGGGEGVGWDWVGVVGGAQSYQLTRLAIEVLKYCDWMDITLVPVYLPGSHNVQADALLHVGGAVCRSTSLQHSRTRSCLSMHHHFWTLGPSTSTQYQACGLE